MLISAEQLARLVLDVFRAHGGGGPWDLSNPATVWQLIRADYPTVTGVRAPPSEEAIRRRYVADFFRDYTSPDTDSDPGPTISQESREAIEYNRELRIRYGSAGPPSPSDEIIQGLDSLRGNPMTSLSFITSMAMGRSRDEAMRVARACGAVYDLASATVDAPVSDTSGEISHSTVGPATRRPPDAYAPEEIRARLSRGYSGGG